MKQLQNSLYIMKQGAYIHKERETIVVDVERTKAMQVPVHSVSGVFCFGNVLVSPALLGFCGENGVNVAFFTEYGRFYGRLQGRKSGSILLRKAQYLADEEQALGVARSVVGAKLVNSRSVLQRHLRNHGGDADVEAAVKHLGASVRLARFVRSMESLRGIEGDGASAYFSVFNKLIGGNADPGLSFRGRSRRPPRDPVNAMLSFLYAIVGQDVSAALQGVGLDPQAGYLHTDRPGRDSLAQDILEEFRSFLADRLVLNLINRRQARESDFVKEPSGAVRMSADLRKALLTALQEKKQEELLHPYLNEKVPIGILPHMQAMLLSRHLRGDLEKYPPFIAR